MSRAQGDGTGGKAAHRVLDAFDQRLAAFAQRTRGRGGVIEIKIHFRCRGDAELGEVVHHCGPIARVFQQPLDAVEKVIFEGRLGVVAQAAQLAGDLGLHLLGGGLQRPSLRATSACTCWVADYS